MTPEANRGASVLAEEFVVHHPEEAALLLEGRGVEEVLALMEELPGAGAAALLEHLSADRGAHLLPLLESEAGKEILGQLPIHRLTTLVAQLEEAEREQVLSRMEGSRAKEVRALLSYPERTAGRLMDPRLLAFPPEMRVEQALERLREARARTRREILVVEEGGRLAGVVPLSELALAEPSAPLREIMVAPRAVVRDMAPEDEVVEVFTERGVTSLPVVTMNGELRGLIRHDALVRATQEEATVDLQTMFGASKEERALSRASFAVRKRLPWLEINLATAFLAAAVVGLFEETIARFTALAVLLPVVAGQSGNTGAQALAVTMRGLALREIRVRDWFRVLRKEASVGFWSGLAVALTTSLFVFLWSGSWGLPLVIGSSMVLSMSIAALSGGAIPLLLTSVGQDPAQSSSIILTTVTDVVGFFSFLGIATVLSGLL